MNKFQSEGKTLKSSYGSSTEKSKATKGKSEKRIWAEIGSVFVFSLGVFILAALFTYHSTDPSFFGSRSSGADWNSVRNACGRMGALVVSLLFEVIGVSSFLIPAALFFIATSIHKREGSLRVAGTLSGMMVSVLSFTVFITLQKKNWEFGGAVLLTGGAVGIWFVEALIHEFNHLGASLLSFCIFLIALAISTPISIAEIGGKFLGVLGSALMRTLKVLGTYFRFILGLLAMKFIQSASAGLQSSVDAMMRWAKNAKENARKTKLEKLDAKKEKIKNEIVEEARTETLKKLDPNSLVVSPLPAVEKQGSGLIVDEVIAKKVKSKLAGLPDNASKIEEEEEGLEEEAIPLSTEKRFQAKSMKGGQITGGGSGVLPVSVPAILPHEHQKQGKLNLNADEVIAAEKDKKPKKEQKKSNWKLPSVDFLVKPPKVENTVDTERLYQNAEILKQKFLDFEIDGEVTAVRPGPVITLYEFKPAAGIKVSRIASLADDISMALSAQSVRIIAPLPGKSVVGIEIPSETRENVFMKEFMTHSEFTGGKHLLPVAMGKDIAGNSYFSDLAKMPHLLCAGQTGSGKSVFMNGLICSLLYRFTPDELRMILVDPKMIEFSSYQEIPHLLLPVVDDSTQAAAALKWAVREMERRYRILAMMNSRNLAGFNQRVDELGGAEHLQEALETAESQVEGMEKLSGGDWTEAFEKNEDGSPRFGKLPYIVIVIDELADLMMTAKKEVEMSIARIAQKARAAGIHLIIATQRPSTDVVTGIIKANLPSRVSCQLASGIDSRTILDRVGAERLLGRGDMFFIPPGTSNLLRLHGAYLSDDEINKITKFLKEQGKPTYRNEILMDEEAENELGEDGIDPEEDPLFTRAVEIAKQNGSASASFLQRHLRVGYNRAARLIEVMESRGIVGPPDGARPREVLVR